MTTAGFNLNNEVEFPAIAAALGLKVDNSPGLLTYLVDEQDVAKAYIGIAGDLYVCEGQSTQELVDKILQIATPFEE